MMVKSRRASARLAFVGLLVASGFALATSPASAATCSISVTYNTSAIWVKQTLLNCPGQMRSVVYWLSSPSGATTYSSAGNWVSNGSTSTASTSSSHYFAGFGRDWK